MNSSSEKRIGRWLDDIASGASKIEKNRSAGTNNKEKYDGFILSLESSNLNSEDVYKFWKRKKIKSITRKLSGVFLIFMAMYLLFLPQMKEVEIVTIYYFNPNDGIALSDLIACLLFTAGVFLISIKNTIF